MRAQEREVAVVATQSKYIRISEVLGYVERTHSHGVPLRVALKRAEKRYGVPSAWVKSWMRSA